MYSHLINLVNRRFDELKAMLIELKGILMSEQDDINAIAGDITAAVKTLSDAITRLEAQIAAGQAPDLTELKAAQAALDALAAANPEPAPPAGP